MKNDLAPTWDRVRARTMVDSAVDAIVSGAARGLILPGDRIVEAEIADNLGVSRVPVREALRMLESQGIVQSSSSRGIRLAPVTRQRVKDLLEVRIALELMSVERVVRKKLHRSEDTLLRLRRQIDEIEIMAARQDLYGLALADVGFHRAFADLAGNEIVSNLWEGIARQLVIVVGLSVEMHSLQNVVEEHRVLLRAIEDGDVKKLREAWAQHINSQNCDIDYEKVIAERRERLRALKAAS
jgi:DNA-binding GntR family transcriptional regulator